MKNRSTLSAIIVTLSSVNIGANEPSVIDFDGNVPVPPEAVDEIYQEMFMDPSFIESLLCMSNATSDFHSECK